MVGLANFDKYHRFDEDIKLIVFDYNFKGVYYSDSNQKNGKNDINL